MISVSAGYRTDGSSTPTIGPDSARGLPDVNQPVLVTIHQRTQQDSAHDAEDRSVGADPQRQREDDRDGESFGANKRARRVFQVAPEDGDCLSHEVPPYSIF